MEMGRIWEVFGGEGKCDQNIYSVKKFKLKAIILI